METSFKQFCKYFFAIALTLFTVSCSSENEDPSKEDHIQLKYQLIGKWLLQENNSEIFEFSKDGSGTITHDGKTEKIKWGCLDKEDAKEEQALSYLRIIHADGSSNDYRYETIGAELHFNEKVYKLDYPILGKWFVEEIDDSQNNKHTYALNFLADGNVLYSWADATGIVAPSQATYRWNRLENGDILIFADGQKYEFAYQLSEDGKLIINKNDVFVRNNPNEFYGEWTSVYSQDGEIKANNKYPFSTLNLFRYSDEKNHIIIKYISESGYQQSREYIWNNYNGNLLELHMDSDPFVLNYRFRYDFAKKQFFLEISKLDDFSQYVGYTKIRSI